MSLAAWIVAFAATLVFGMGLGVRWEKGQQAIRDVAAQEHAREVRMQRERAIDMAAEGHEKDKRGIRERFVVITERIEHEIHTSPFYAADAPACLDAHGLRELAAAVGAATPSGVAAPAVPPASRPR